MKRMAIFKSKFNKKKKLIDITVKKGASNLRLEISDEYLYIFCSTYNLGFLRSL